MTRVLAGAAAAILLSVGFIACGGGGSGTSAPGSVTGGTVAPPGGGAPTSAATGGNASITLVIPSASTGASSTKRRPAYVSSATQSVAVFASVASATPPPTATTLVNVGAGQPNCSAVATGTSCTITVPAVYGAMTFTVKTYDGLLGTGNLLSQATFTQTISPNQSVIPVTLSGVVAGTKVSVPQFSYPAGGGTFTLTVNALDANGAIIAGGGTYSEPVTIGISDPTTVTASPNPVTGPGQPVTITYSASAPSGITLRANAAGLSALAVGSVDVSFSQPAASNATAYLLDTNQKLIVGFNAGANGFPAPESRRFFSNIAAYGTSMAASPTQLALGAPFYGGPITTFPLPSGSAVAIDYSSSLGEVDGVAYDESSDATSGDIVAALTYLGTTIAYFSPTASGTAVPVASFTGPAISTEYANGIGVDHSGNVYVLVSYPTPAIYVFPPGSSGFSATPSETITLPSSSQYPFGLAVAADGTMAVLLSSTGPTTPQEMLIYNAAGTLQTTLTGGPIANSYGGAFTFASDDSLYFATQSTVYVYAPGTTGAQPPVRAFSAGLAGAVDVGQIALTTPLAQSTPAAGSVSGDMLALTANRTWNYAVTNVGAPPATVTVYDDPQPVDGNIGLVAFVKSGTEADALPADGGTVAASAGFSEGSDGYHVQSYGSVSNDSFGLIPGTPLLVPSTLTLGQTFIPYPGVTATVRGIGSPSGISACPGSPAAGATVYYVFNSDSEQISYVPGCGIVHLITDAGTNFTLTSVGSHPEVGQQSVVRRTLNATYGDTLHSLWQALLVRH